MLRDLLEFVRNPYPWYLAPMGYVRELAGIADRARLLEPAWREHLERSRSVIRESAEACDRCHAVLVVGSGNLLDVPMDRLCKQFDKVVLLDILHRRATKQITQNRPNVELLAADVTGIADAIFRAARSREVRKLPKSVPPVLDGRDFDLVVSVNLLSQLGVIPCNFLKGHHPAIPPAQLSALTRDLIDTHLRWINELAGRTCLITDVLRIEKLTTSEVIEKDIVEGAVLPPPDETWDWSIAPEGSVYFDRSVIHQVRAYGDFRLVNDAR